MKRSCYTTNNTGTDLLCRQPVVSDETGGRLNDRGSIISNSSSIHGQGVGSGHDVSVAQPVRREREKAVGGIMRSANGRCLGCAEPHDTEAPLLNLRHQLPRATPAAQRSQRHSRGICLRQGL